MNRRELKEHVARLEFTLERIRESRPPIEGGREYVIKENDDWIYGITERPDGTFSSVWMKIRT